MDFLTPEIFDLLVIVVIILGLALAGIRLYDDFTRPLPPPRPAWSDDDTQPQPPVPQPTDEPPGE